MDGSDSDLDHRYPKATLSISLEIPSLWMYGEVYLTLIIANFSSDIESRFHYDKDKFYSLQFHEVLKNASRIFHPLESISLDHWVSYIDQAQVLYNLNIFMGKVSSETISINGSQSIATAVNWVTNSLFGVTSAFINAYVDNQIDPGSTSSKSNATQDGTWNVYRNLTIVIMLAICVIFISLVCLHSTRNTYVSKALKTETSSSVVHFHQIPRFSPKVTEQLSSSLMFHPSIDTPTQLLVPIAIVGTIFLFISSNLSIGASVDLIFRQLDGTTASFPNLFIFSLGKTIGEMFHAGTYLLMTLVLLFSGVFPYIKLLLLLCAWVCPDVYLQRERRQLILSFLDAYGKFSLVDNFVLVLMLVSFHFELSILGTWSTFVTPDYGFYSFMLATVLSLLLGHYVVYLHHTSLFYATNSISSNIIAKETIWNHSFKSNRLKGKHGKLSMVAKYLWIALMGLSSLSVAVGFGSPFISFEFEGLVGSLMGSHRKVVYSMINLGKAIPESAINPSLGILMIQWTYFFFTIFMPLFTLVIIAVMFSIPITTGQFRRLILFAEICNAWNALDVFLVSVVASLLELPTFANFMVGHRCDIINRIIKDNFETFDGKDVCFGIHTSIGKSSWVLITGTLLQSHLIRISLKVARLALRERIEADCQNWKKKKNEDDQPTSHADDTLPGFFFLWK